MVSSLYFLNEHKKLVHSVASRLAHDTVMFFDHIKPKNNSFATLVTWISVNLDSRTFA